MVCHDVATNKPGIPRRARTALVSALLVFVGFPLGAQEAQGAGAGVASAGTGRRPGLPAVESPGPPVSPRRAFLYSLAVPGLGQAALDRPFVGATMFLIEGFSIALAHRSGEDLRIAQSFLGDSVPLRYEVDPATGLAQRHGNGDPVVAEWRRARFTSELVKARKLHLEDWIAVVVFNHLFAGADAFVAAQLWDVPQHLSLRAAPLLRGGAMITVSVPLR